MSQVSTLTRRGIRCCYISGDQGDDAVKEGVVKGEFQLVYMTPEMLIKSKRWRRVLHNEVYSCRLRAFVVDEAHTVSKW